MIYILYILYFVWSIFDDSAKTWTPSEVTELWNRLLICIAILPIWYSIRQCVSELQKIRKLIEKKDLEG
jgi:hypothetical protein